ncbi:MAG: hypothetical protein ABSG75_09840 [Syntrophales bacterium]|jgi:hypothetical protein
MMEEREHTGVIDNPENSSPSPDNPATDVSDKIGSASRNSSASEETKPALSQRLAEAFREGVASASPEYEKRPEVKTPPPAKSSLQEPSGGGILDRVIQEGGSAAAAVGDTAANLLGAFVQLVKKAPSLTQKYAEAFREGAASVTSREGRERREEVPRAANKKGPLSDGRAILDKVFQAGESAAGFMRQAVADVNPGELFGTGQKIRMCKKKINNLYIDIGREAVNSWSNGLVETEMLASLLDELRKNEEDILNMQAHLAEVAAARKTGAARGPQTVKKEAAFTPTTDKEEDRVDAGVSGAMTDELVDHPGDLHEPEIRIDVAPYVADLSVSAVSDSESPEGRSVPEGTVDVEAAPREEMSGEAGLVMLEETEVSRKKPKGDPSGDGGATRRTSKRRGGRR